MRPWSTNDVVGCGCGCVENGTPTGARSCEQHTHSPVVPVPRCPISSHVARRTVHDTGAAQLIPAAQTDKPADQPNQLHKLRRVFKALPQTLTTPTTQPGTTTLRSSSGDRWGGVPAGALAVTNTGSWLIPARRQHMDRQPLDQRSGCANCAWFPGRCPGPRPGIRQPGRVPQPGVRAAAVAVVGGGGVPAEATTALRASISAAVVTSAGPAMMRFTGRMTHVDSGFFLAKFQSFYQMALFNPQPGVRKL